MNDRKLPGLARALNDEVMASLFASSLGWPGASRSGPAPIRHRVLKYTPGKRCVVAYQFQTNDEPARPRQIIGKIYRKNRGQIIFENCRQLWQAAGANGSLGMPEPLAYLPEIGMVLQSVVPGRTLTDFSTQDDLVGAVRAVAINLAALHGLPVATGEKKTLDDHIKKYCHPGPQALAEVCPETAPLVEKILGGFACDVSLGDAPVGPVHGDLNLAQIFIDGRRAFFIDFDGFCLSHAALDAGNFLVTLRAHFGSASEMLAGAFLDSYTKACRSPRMLTGLRTYQAFACLRRAVICTRAPAGPDWRQKVQQLLETGSTFIDSEKSVA